MLGQGPVPFPSCAIPLPSLYSGVASARSCVFALPLALPVPAHPVLRVLNRIFVDRPAYSE
jgi:hypothetical protein